MDVQTTAAAMLEELQSTRLVVMKWRKDDVWIRGPISTNPEWYQRLCEQFQRSRKRYPKSRTFIKRFAVERALKRIADGQLWGTVDAVHSRRGGAARGLRSTHTQIQCQFLAARLIGEPCSTNRKTTDFCC